MKQAINILNQWIEAVNQGDVERLLSFYDSSAVLIPTFSNRTLDTTEKHRSYFKQLASREDLGITLHDNSLIIQTVEPAVAILSGLYNWQFKVDDQLLNFEARFTYVLNLLNERPIMHHHSSQIPRML